MSLRVAERWHPNKSQDIALIWGWLIMPCGTEAVFSAYSFARPLLRGVPYETMLNAEATFYRHATGTILYSYLPSRVAMPLPQHPPCFLVIVWHNPNSFVLLLLPEDLSIAPFCVALCFSQWRSIVAWMWHEWNWRLWNADHFILSGHH